MRMTVTMTALAAACFMSAPLTVSAQNVDDADTEEVATPKKKKVKKAKAPAPVDKMFVAISRFENKSEAGDREVQTIRDRITGAVVNTRKFDVVERERIKDLLKEQNLAATGVTDSEDAPQAGKMKAAGYVIYGTVLSYGDSKTSAAMGDVSGSKFESKVEVQIRITNAETGKILTDQIVQSSGTVTKTAGGGVSQVGNYSQQAMRNACDTVCRDAVFLLLDQAYPVKVLAVGDESVTLNVNKDLVKEDDLFNVYEEPTFEEDPDTHELIPVDGKLIGRVAITEPGAKTSKAEPVDWVKVRGKKATPQEAVDIDSIEKGMVLRKVSEKTLLKEKQFLKEKKAATFESRF